jgi:hypothetical protein
VLGKASLLFCLFAISGSGSAWAQQILPTGTRALIKCGGQPEIAVTADAEQAIPLRLVERAACGADVVVLADTQGYTIKVRTASGKSGYVARYALAIASPAKRSAPSTVTAPNATPERATRTSGAAGPKPERNSSSKPRVYISDTASWTASGGFANPSSVAPGDLYGGYNPEMVDIYQDFTSDCSAMIVTQEKSKADFAVLFDKGTSKKGITGLGGLVKVNRVMVLSRSGTTLLSRTAHSADAAVRMACTAVSQTRTTLSNAGSQNGKAPR